MRKLTITSTFLVCILGIGWTTKSRWLASRINHLLCDWLSSFTFSLLFIRQKSPHMSESFFEGWQHLLTYLELNGTWVVLDRQSILAEELDQHLVLQFVLWLAHLNNHIFRRFGLSLAPVLLWAYWIIDLLFSSRLPCVAPLAGGPAATCRSGQIFQAFVTKSLFLVTYGVFGSLAVGACRLQAKRVALSNLRRLGVKRA